MLKPQLTEFMRRMNPKSVAIIPAAREAVRSHDTNYRYRQNSDFFYLTGFEEPEAIAVIAPSKQKKFTLFVRPRDLDQEIWYGYRAGVEGAVRDYNADEAFITSSSKEIMPVVQIDELKIGKGLPGRRTYELEQRFIEMIEQGDF